MVSKTVFENPDKTINGVLKQSLNKEEWLWITHKLNTVIQNKSAKDLFILYSLIPRKIKPVSLFFDTSETSKFIQERNTSVEALSRVYVLIQVLEADELFFSSKIEKMFETSDTNELATLLRYLILFPKPELFLEKAVDAIRTNITTVFDAIALNNPYPSQYFNELQWNQAYLKAEFMGRKVHHILHIKERSNATLAKIISDYAHERWAAGRTVNPVFWQPVTHFINNTILEDIARLFQGGKKEQMAATLCCYYSNNAEAKKLLQTHNQHINLIESEVLNWKQLAIL